MAVEEAMGMEVVMAMEEAMGMEDEVMEDAMGMGSDGDG